ANVAGELLKGADILDGNIADEVAVRPLLVALRETIADDLVDRLALGGVGDVVLGEALVDVRHLLAVGRRPLENADVARRQLAGPFHRRRNPAPEAGLGALAAGELEAEIVGAIEESRDLRTECLEPLFAAPLDAAWGAPGRGLQHRDPGQLVGQVPL